MPLKLKPTSWFPVLSCNNRAQWSNLHHTYCLLLIHKHIACSSLGHGPCKAICSLFRLSKQYSSSLALKSGVSRCVDSTYSILLFYMVISNKDLQYSVAKFSHIYSKYIYFLYYFFLFFWALVFELHGSYWACKWYGKYPLPSDEIGTTIKL